MKLTQVKMGLGFGVSGGMSASVLGEALKCGVRYFDLSSFYAPGCLSELDAILTAAKLTRADIHLSYKLWITNLGRNRRADYEPTTFEIAEFVRSTLLKHHLTYFDSLVIHWPLKVDSSGIPDEFIIEEVWPQLELLVEESLAKSIGVSNFCIIDLHRLLNVARLRPISNQFEFNPYANNTQLVSFCLANGIQAIGHSPFHFGWKSGHHELFSDPTIIGIANKYNVKPAQVVIAWICSKGVTPIPGTTNPNHVMELANALNLNLSYADRKAIDRLNRHDYNYYGILDYFGIGFKKKYLKRDIEIRVYDENLVVTGVSIYARNFLECARKSIVDGPGFLIIPKLFDDIVGKLKEKILDGKHVVSSGRWDGMGTGARSIINTGSEILEMLDDPLLSLIVEALLGWDCKLDNISASTSRIAPNAQVLGPHQDSPFEQNPGCPLPPREYPMVLQAIIALDEFTAENGPLFVMPNSHKKRMRVNLPWMGNQKKGTVPEGSYNAVVPAGSVILAVGHIWHGAALNRTDKPRLGVLIEYVTSVCETRDKFPSTSIPDALLMSCSRRVIRLLNDGKMYFHDDRHLLKRFAALKGEKVPGFAIAK